jgi:protein-S-isoprenylcysteine O-methyltransferase Ste14
MAARTPTTAAVLIPAVITQWKPDAWGPWPLIVVIAVALMVAGAYRCVRNPMYVAVGSLIGGQALLCPSLGIVLYWQPVCVLSRITGVSVRRDDLASSYSTSPVKLECRT